MKKISEWVGLRNFMAHEYLDYRWQEIRDFLDNAETHLGKFIYSSKQFLKENEQGE